MDFTAYTSIKQQFVSAPSLCRLLKLLSIETWKRIEHAYNRSNVRIFETTITQNLIFAIHAYADQFNLNIEILESKDENANGNDVELVVRYPDDGVEFYAPIQAKKIYRSGAYRSIHHRRQIESLIAYASRMNAIPFYLLYNFTSAQFDVAPGTARELYGCTLVPAEYLLKNFHKSRRRKNGEITWKIPHFLDLHPQHAFCLHEFACERRARNFMKRLIDKSIISSSGVSDSIRSKEWEIPGAPGFFPLGTFEKDHNWMAVTEQKASGTYSDERLDAHKADGEDRHEAEELNVAQGREEIGAEFKPQSRLILTLET